MGIRQLLSISCREPRKALEMVAARLDPATTLRRLEVSTLRSGLRKPCFLLSFDCDTDLDIECARDVHTRLTGMGILPVYLVPGEILERGAAVWKGIAETGAEFLNHGYREHTVYRNGAYHSTLFYSDMTDAERREDMLRGHAVVCDIVGQSPLGFRTPHFGTYSSERDLLWLHGILREMGYAFSSSSTPYTGLTRGPSSTRFGLLELPVSGCPDFPLTILDSYTFRFVQNRFSPSDYVVQAHKWAELLRSGRTFFVNLYADPSQVADWPEFFEAMGALAPYARQSYREIVAEVS